MIWGGIKHGLCWSSLGNRLTNWVGLSVEPRIKIGGKVKQEGDYVCLEKRMMLPNLLVLSDHPHLFVPSSLAFICPCLMWAEANTLSRVGIEFQMRGKLSLVCLAQSARGEMSHLRAWQCGSGGAAIGASLMIDWKRYPKFHVLYATTVLATLRCLPKSSNFSNSSFSTHLP